MIRKYNENDINQIESLAKELHDSYKFDLNIYSLCYVLDVDSIIKGFITYSVMYDRAEIIDIVVLKDARNNNYGSLLLNTVLEEIKDKCNNITLEVNINNKVAINFYKKNGFEIVAIRKNYYNGQDAYLMEKKWR